MVIETAGCVTEEALLAELTTAMQDDRERAADLCEILFGDRRIGERTTYCKVALALRRSAIRSPRPGDRGRTLQINDLDPHGLSIEVPAGPARVFQRGQSPTRIRTKSPSPS